MHWQTFVSTLAGGLITFSAILLTNALDLCKRKRTHDKLIHALLQGLRDEIAGLLEMAEASPVRPLESVPEGKPYEGLFTASQDYFIVYHANAGLVMQIADPKLRRSIIQTYTRAKAVLDTVNMNRLYLERYHYLQSTFLKTKDASIQAESENYQRALVQIAGQLKEADAQFRRTAAGLLEMLSDKIGTEAEEKRLIPTRTSGLEFAPAQSE
ncbi:MAG TPA: hypothetical protein VNZ64_15745 [Candidatus Acidoferrum sp.]|jgi:hypothetical protein|nr:hypothetical protein [Candidatus Acidoferrum sp.]